MSNREKPTHLPESVDVVSLRLLSDALRKEMPENFIWNYGHFHTAVACGTLGCALGLAQDMGLIPKQYGALLPPQFGLHDSIHRALFYASSETMRGPLTYGDKCMTEVTPTDVADAIDYYLDHGRLP